MDHIRQVLRSSKDENTLSLTIKGVLTAFIPVILGIARFYGLEGIDETYITNTINAIMDAVQAGTVFVSAAMVAWGMIRKPFYNAKRRVESENTGD